MSIEESQMHINHTPPWNLLNKFKIMNFKKFKKKINKVLKKFPFLRILRGQFLKKSLKLTFPRGFEKTTIAWNGENVDVWVSNAYKSYGSWNLFNKF